MMSSAADKLNKLKIADLKPILAKAGLPVSGKKNELVDRILASKEALAAAGLGEEPAPAAAQEDMNADLPDLPPAEESTISNPVPTPAPTAAPQAADPPLPTTTATASDAPKLNDEAELRRKRAERFGIPFVDEQKKPAAPAKPASNAAASKAKPVAVAAEAPPASAEELERLRKRAERFGLPVAAPGATSNGRSKSAAKETAPPAVVDPAEEERKRKRAERFGIAAGAPVEKKAKADS